MAERGLSQPWAVRDQESRLCAVRILESREVLFRKRESRRFVSIFVTSQVYKAETITLNKIKPGLRPKSPLGARTLSPCSRSPRSHRSRRLPYADGALACCRLPLIPIAFALSRAVTV